ncbi:MAG: glycosyltransferase family 4 protein, partial [Methylobacterium mesophilicum]|nr:glycosyltransferase family 4 protein [Methylobacterium mesophilicum]
LRAFKGGVLAVHTIAALRRSGIAAELLVAGKGVDAAYMQQAADRLGVADAVRFLGLVSDMGGFFDGIDILLHPALREPYGNIAAEAQCFGVPVVTTYIDGLPEVVAHEETGICVYPDLEKDEFASFGGDASDIYALVYHPSRRGNGADRSAAPEEGVIEAPRFASPQAFAEAVAAVVSSADVYAGFSARAIERARRNFTPAVHIDRLIDRMKLAISL